MNNNKKIIRKSDTRNSDNRSRDNRDNMNQDNRSSYSNNKGGENRGRRNGSSFSRNDRNSENRGRQNRDNIGGGNRERRNGCSFNRDDQNSDNRMRNNRNNRVSRDNQNRDSRQGDKQNYRNRDERNSDNQNRRSERSERGGNFRNRDDRNSESLNSQSRNRSYRSDDNGNNGNNRNSEGRGNNRGYRNDNSDNRSRGGNSHADNRSRENRKGDNRRRDDMNRDNRSSYNDNNGGKNRGRRSDRSERGGDFRNGSNRENRNNGNHGGSNFNNRNRNNRNTRDNRSYQNSNNQDLANSSYNNDSIIVDVNNDETISEINSSNRKKKSIITMSFADVKALCRELGYPEFHASQILDFIYKRNVLSFDDISPLPKAFREKLNEEYYIHNCSIKSIQTDETNTKKMLISLYDNKEIEAVILQKDDRITFCLSSQVGCAYGCKFCATGTMGFKRNLTSEEILAQFLLLRHEAKSVNSIVFMGMGEPLANAKNVFAAIREINNYKGFNLGIRHITISTVGEVGGIKSLIERDLDVRLAVSLHSLKDDVRSTIMPINKKYSLKGLIPMLKRYSSSGKRIITFEWVLIDGVNDTVNDAYRLVNLKREMPFKVNLIALNPVAGSQFKPSSKDNMKRFAKILTDNGVTVVQRFKQGQKIAAGCGQLAIKTSRMLEH